MTKYLVVSSEQMTTLEESCFNTGLPVASLMEKAGLKSAHFIKRNFPLKKFNTVGVLVGPGHNGGDALVVARELFLAGYKVITYVTEQNIKPLSQAHLNYFQLACSAIYDDYKYLQDCSFFVDGMFGFGLNRSLELKYQEMIHWLNSLKKPVVAIDMPSGMDTKFGVNLSACVKASHTLCLGFYKEGLLADHASNYVGDLHLVTLGITSAIVNKALRNKNDENNKKLFTTPIAQALTQKSIRLFFPKINYQAKQTANKYSRGTALLFCGSQQYPGAALIAAQSSLAAGCGYVGLYTTPHAKSLLIKNCPEVVISSQEITQKAMKKYLTNKNFGILYGPGITKSSPANTVKNIIKNSTNSPNNTNNAISTNHNSTTNDNSVDNDNASTSSLLEIIDIIAAAHNPETKNTYFPTIVVDATGLLEVQENWEKFSAYPGQKILTPHLMEFKTLFPHLYERLVTEKSPEITEKSLNKFECAKLAAKESNCIIVLKGPKTIVCDTAGNCYVNVHSTPALAKAGTGDVLAGYITGLISRGIPPMVAACYGVFNHSLAAIQLKNKFGINSISVKKIIQKLAQFEL